VRAVLLDMLNGTQRVGHHQKVWQRKVLQHVPQSIQLAVVRSAKVGVIVKVQSVLHDNVLALNMLLGQVARVDGCGVALAGIWDTEVGLVARPSLLYWVFT
jgi:hypothetical protein